MPDVIPCLGCQYLRQPVATVKKHEDSIWSRLCLHPQVAKVRADWITGKETVEPEPVDVARGIGACGPDAKLRTI